MNECYAIILIICNLNITFSKELTIKKSDEIDENSNADSIQLLNFFPFLCKLLLFFYLRHGILINKKICITTRAMYVCVCVR